MKVRLGYIFPIMFAVAGILATVAIADDTERYQETNGIAVYLGVMPSELILGHSSSQEGMTHSTAQPNPESQHVVVALFDSRTGKRITDAKVTAKVEQPGHLASTEKELEPMKIADTITYGNFFTMPRDGAYRIFVQIRKPGSQQIAKVQFKYHHP